jgi:hypothetical protein
MVYVPPSQRKLFKMLSAPCRQQYEDIAGNRGQRAPDSHAFFLLFRTSRLLENKWFLNIPPATA